MKKHLATVALLFCIGCADRNPTAPSASALLNQAPPSGTAATPTAAVPGQAGSLAVPANPSETPEVIPVPGHIRNPVEFPMSQGIISFPPRNEPNAFFINLQLLYRDILRRPQTAPSYVDPEGVNVWMTEYFRFYLNGCTHDAAVQRTLIQVTTGISQPTCGFETPVFPPRNLPNAFMAQLQAVYRDVLRRPLLVGYVDVEGANVWISEYLRYRVAGCDHLNGEQKVFQQILGFGVQPVCSGSSGGGSTVTFNGTVGANGRTRHTVTVTGPVAANANVRLTWSDPSVDLDLYGTTTACAGDNPFNCPLLGFSIAESGTSEQMVIDIRPGTDVYLWVDNFTNRAQSYTIVAQVAPGPGVSPTDEDVDVQISPAVAGPAKPESAPKFRR